MAIESTYFHTMSVSRLTRKKNTHGATVQEYTAIPILQLVPCAFSVSKSSSINTTRSNTNNTIVYEPKIFCNPNLDIKAGDRIEVLFNTRNLGSFTAGVPYIYSSHQEVPLKKKGEADTKGEVF